MITASRSTWKIVLSPNQIVFTQSSDVASVITGKQEDNEKKVALCVLIKALRGSK